MNWKKNAKKLYKILDTKGRFDIIKEAYKKNYLKKEQLFNI